MSNKEITSKAMPPQHIKIEAEDWRKVLMKIIDLDKRMTDLEQKVYERSVE